VVSSASREAIIVANENDDDRMELEDHDPEIPVMQSRRATVSAGTSARNPYKARPSTLRDWPFGEPKVKNDEDFLELELNTGPFTPEEISAKVMAKELIIHCKPASGRKEATPKEIFRCYPLPLSVAPLASDVSILKDDHWIRIAVRKETSLLRSPIGLFTPEMAEIVEEEQRIDV